MLSVAEIMTPKPYTLTPVHTVLDAAELMREHKIHHIPIVTDNGTVTGIVSQRDVLAASHSSLTLERKASDSKDSSIEACISLGAVMSSPVKSVNADAALLAVAATLRSERIGCLPVIEEGKLIGIVSDTDFLEVAMTLLEQLEVNEPEDDY